jgi:hypothetical protein
VESEVESVFSLNLSVCLFVYDEGGLASCACFHLGRIVVVEFELCYFMDSLYKRFWAARSLMVYVYEGCVM